MEAPKVSEHGKGLVAALVQVYEDCGGHAEVCAAERALLDRLAALEAVAAAARAITNSGGYNASHWAEDSVSLERALAALDALRGAP